MNIIWQGRIKNRYLNQRGFTFHGAQPLWRRFPAGFCCAFPGECRAQPGAAAVRLCCSGGSAGSPTACSSSVQPGRTTAPYRRHHTLVLPKHIASMWHIPLITTDCIIIYNSFSLEKNFLLTFLIYPPSLLLSGTFVTHVCLLTD